MKLDHEGWTRHFAQNPAPVYLLEGNEALLVDEALAELNAFLRDHGYQERCYFQVNSGLNVAELEEVTQNLSLFAQKKRIELQCGEKIPAEIAQWMIRFCEQTQKNQDICLIIKAPKLSVAEKRAKWIAAVEKIGIIFTLPEVSLADFPLWLDRRLFRARLKLDQEARGALMMTTEGNLFAATQVINKLMLLSERTLITLDDVTPLLADNSNYDLFDLSRQFLLGNLKASFKILAQLKIRSEPVLVLWVLSKELKLLLKLHRQKSHTTLTNLYRSLQIWGARQKEFAVALQRIQPDQVEALLASCSKIDFAIKGLRTEEPWELIRQLILDSGLKR